MPEAGENWNPQKSSIHARHPEAAAAARVRLNDLHAPAHQSAATDEPALITDKATLAHSYRNQPRRKYRQIVPPWLQPIIAAVATFILLIVLLKAPVLISQISYSRHTPPTGPTTVVQTAGAIIPPTPTISIPELNVGAPVTYENTRNETQIDNDLENGVIHYAGTALPGQAGNAVIFGHSSNDWWQPGNYKFVFVLLDKLQPGDQFSVNYNSVHYIYSVTGSSVVEPTDLSVLDPTPTPTMTLITCTPPGTSWKRLVVTAKQISPNPNQATAAPASTQSAPASLPNTEGGSGLWQQLKGTVSGIGHSISSLFGGNNANNIPQELPATN